MGLFSTHAIVYARVIIKGKDYGLEPFMVQIRDSYHKPMPGCELGDVGKKIGYNSKDNGFLRFD